MRFEPRKYQSECVEALWDTVIFSPDKAPVIAVPTGAGKTVIMGMFIQQYIEANPENQVVVLSHTQDILQQDHEALEEFFDFPIGIYSAGLGTKKIRQITVAGIQSAYRVPEKFQWTNLYLVDEVHTVNHKATGMYRTLLDPSPAIKVGMSATCFRTGHGYIYEGDTALFDTLAYDLTSLESFNGLVEDGYLTKLISVAPNYKMNSNGVKKSGGDYNLKQLAAKHDQDHVTEIAVTETIKYGHNYKKWLIFAIDIDHADHICTELVKGGVDAEVLHSRMDKDRGSVVRNFKSGTTRCIVSVGMVTTGFDAPNVDLVVLLRPTMSAVLHVQMVGRGLRVADGKDHCLVLDFAGNTRRLGPINNVIVPDPKGNGNGEAPTKECPECCTILYAAARECDTCGWEFIFETKLTTSADDVDIMAGAAKNPDPKWLNVTAVRYGIHKKTGKPDSLLVSYHCGITVVKDWVCLNHQGTTKIIANHWAKYRGHRGLMTTEAVFTARQQLKKPVQILIDSNSKYTTVKDCRF